jgi:cyclohexa-1,5-dienecarbonyl-CoA hydratase
VNDERIAGHIEDGLGRITLKAGSHNVLGTSDLRELTVAVRELDGCAVVLLEAQGERAFSAGVEIADHVADRADAMLDAFSDAAFAFREASPVIVCAVGGPALGGGFELMLLADLAICSTRAFFALPEVQLAALPPIACALLPRLTGERRAFDAIVTGRRIDAGTALAWGLVSEVVEPEELAERAQAICRHLLSYSHDAIRACKRAMRAGDLRGAMRVYRDELLPTDDAAEGIQAFLEKRPPIWAHTRQPVEVSAS